ncbi:putative enoyl-CoA hydratase echA8 [Clostridium homopropionicum DSM 5847]|uniref:short-chain-enoyl-CoA hydratase n=1 Tax=Clostridium homopropionicum DSM 5847 TaxID=1121318 RepID=A0A0L6Z5N5_9CLOT|nr:enoyl-CoA hydratase-related protein [Clostridium homopropionicum]KOA18266.1 putative enoyl-CoA hydratase echA8 [Clostridium homopropionicum DSM 5847]SFF70176.1 enoyl-CoA hydratase [Clostridium homopropionicum]
MQNNVVLYEQKGNMAYVTINRPEALNALNGRVLKSLNSVLDLIRETDEISTVIIKGAGNKAFVAGADIKEMSGMNCMEARAFSKLGQEVFNKIEKLPKAVIAAVNGFALGGGCELAMACDIRIATKKSKFALPELGLGVIPGFAGTQRMPRLVGKGRAKEMMFTSKQVGAEEAYRIGLVNEVVDEENFLNYCDEMAKTIGTRSKAAIAICKSSVNEGMELDIDKAMLHEADLFGLCFSTEDQREGMGAFIEKRKPIFK